MLRCAVLVVAACLATLGAPRTFAAADSSDDESVTRGAQLYDLYCSSCHGNDPAERYGALYVPNETDVDEGYGKLQETMQRARASMPKPAEARPKEDWPEWADTFGSSHKSDEAEIKKEVGGALSQAIDQVQAEPLDPDTQEIPDTQQDPDDESASSDTNGFDPLPGATNLADPTAYFYGTSDDELFNSIANGTGTAMPGWRAELGSDEAVWDLVNYLRSLWDEAWRQ